MIAAVIVHHGDPAMTVRALESVGKSRNIEIQSVLVDHGPGPGDRLMEAARAWNALYLHPGENLGFAGGLNAGIREVRSRGGAGLFLFLNHDVVLDPEAAAMLARRFSEDSTLGVSGPAILDAREPGLLWNAGSRIDWPSARPRSLYHGQPLGDLPGKPYPVGFVCGCAAMVRGELLDRIEILRQDYFLYFEDAELSLQARRAGYRVEVDPRARVLHTPGAAVSRLSGLAEYCRARNRILFSRRWGPPGPRALLERWRFALSRCARGGAARRGALAGLLNRAGPPPADLLVGP